MDVGIKKEMDTLYEHTSLTPLKVAKSTGFLDWDSQPSMFKHYPKFLFRYNYLEEESLEIIKYARLITSETAISSKPYYRLNTPSAGNLHPIELYVQIRGIKGIISGIYHVDAEEGTIVLIKEVNKDGIENCVGMTQQFEGMIFVQSCIPYRSVWKYGDRAFRYCFLDAGHQIGALQAACDALGQKVTILSDYYKKLLDLQMGFTEEEFSCAAFAIGKPKEKDVKELRRPLIKVYPLDYSDNKEFVENELSKANIYEDMLGLESGNVAKDVILQRRSARSFINESLNENEFSLIMDMLNIKHEEFSSYVISLDKETRGVYKNGVLETSGYFGDEITGMLVDQHFIKRGSLVLVLTANEFSSNSLMNSSVFAHNAMLRLEKIGLQSSGIGAFYDKKLQKFLQTKEYVQYVCVVGK